MEENRTNRIEGPVVALAGAVAAVAIGSAIGYFTGYNRGEDHGAYEQRKEATVALNNLLDDLANEGLLLPENACLRYVPGNSRRVDSIRFGELDFNYEISLYGYGTERIVSTEAGNCPPFFMELNRGGTYALSSTSDGLNPTVYNVNSLEMTFGTETHNFRYEVEQ
ncbi:hypothetical protein COV16_01815 [Candidatus Woesearchaeota archaeon CG10_big_fil_rev_8_21_14_0_10_34_8]|nr:MAG: hypothetical protein COV16_01815 [Candidatus Woesearchaeota archaeon CG10_big_fil_rev_8_21_14_0_10_34_8]